MNTRVPTGTDPGDIPNIPGLPGKSAYQVALDNGFSGSESAWLASLEGPPGPASTVPGPGATVAVGTTVTLAAGNPATVTNSGTSGAAVFNFSIPAGVDGKPLEIQVTGTHIQTRLEGESWTDLIALAAITGVDGKPLEIQVTGTHIQTRLAGGSWANLIALADLKGAAGKSAYQVAVDDGFVGDETAWLASLKGEPGDPGAAATVAVGTTTTLSAGASATVTNSGTSSAAIFNFSIPAGEDGKELEIQVTGTHIQTRLTGGSWTNLIALADLKGADGKELEIQVTGTHIQTRLEGGSWTNLIALSALKGDAGNNGWSPTLAIVSDGTRRVQQVIDWAGGSGTKPTTGLYVGASGLTATIGDAIDVRGPEGPPLNETFVSAAPSGGICTLDFAGGARNFAIGTLSGDVEFQAANLGSGVNGRRGVITADQNSTGGWLADYDTDTFTRTTGANPQFITTALRRQVMEYVVENSLVMFLGSWRPVVPIYTAQGFPTPVLWYDFSALTNNATTAAGTVASNVVTALTNLGSMSGADFSGLSVPWHATAFGGHGCAQPSSSGHVITLPDLSGITNPEVMFSVSRVDSGTRSSALDLSNNSTDYPQELWVAGASWREDFCSTTYNDISTSGSSFNAALGNTGIFSLSKNGGTVSRRLNGVSRSTYSASGPIRSNPKMLGTTSGRPGGYTYFKGNFAVLMLWDAPLTTNQRNAAHSYLSSHLSITLE